MGVVANTPDLGTAIDGILSCLADALEESGRGVCQTGTTVGPVALGPGACSCNCATSDHGGELTGQLLRLFPISVDTFGDEVRIEDCVPGAVGADLGFKLTRCYPPLKDNLTMPTLDEVAPYADGVTDDVQIMWLAFQCGCLDGMKLAIREMTIDGGPEGGCSGIAVVVTVVVKPARPVVDVS